MLKALYNVLFSSTTSVHSHLAESKQRLWGGQLVALPTWSTQSVRPVFFLQKWDGQEQAQEVDGSGPKGGAGSVVGHQVQTVFIYLIYLLGVALWKVWKSSATAVTDTIMACWGGKYEGGTSGHWHRWALGLCASRTREREPGSKLTALRGGHF